MNNKYLVESWFDAWSKGDRSPLFGSISDDVRWTVVGTCPGAGTYQSKASFLSESSGPVQSMLKSPAWPQVDEVLTSGDTVIVRWRGSTETKLGGTYRNSYCWLLRLQGGIVTEIISYLDTLAVMRLYEERDQNQLDLRTVDTLLSTTRAIRKRLNLDRPVERELILDCIRLSQQAPTGSNAQSWRWIVVTDPELKRSIAELYRDGGRPHIETVLSNRHLRDAQGQRMIDSAMFLYDNLERVPVLVFPCLEGRIPDDTRHARRATYYASIYPAVWSFMLALRSRGLGSVLTTLHLANEEAIGKLLQIPSSLTQMAMVPAGYISGHQPRAASRPPVEDIVRWEGWTER
jgi:nitroreductase/ketosteroid isomerase-like protein